MPHTSGSRRPRPLPSRQGRNARAGRGVVAAVLLSTSHEAPLAWSGGRWTKDLPRDLVPDMQADEHDPWHELSTFRPHAGGRTSEEQAAKVCLSCRMALPLTGVCDSCG